MQTELLVGTSAIAVGTAGALAANWWINWLATDDSFFTRNPEGAAKFIMRGDSFDHLIMSYEGWHLNDPHASFFDRRFPKWEVLRDEPDKRYHVQDPFTHWIGVRFMGFNPNLNVLKYRFVWKEDEVLDNGKTRVRPRNEITDFIFIRDTPYIVILQAAETCEGVPVDLQYQLVIQINNPYKAIFGASKWMDIVTNAANRCARSYVGSHTYKQLQSEMETDDAGNKVSDVDPAKFSCPIIKLNKELPDDSPDHIARGERGLSGRYGVTIVSANPQTVDLVGDNADKYQDATTAEFLAEKEAFATRTKADANAYATEKEGQAAANVIRMKGDAESGSLKARLEALKDAGELGMLMLQTDAMIANGEGKTIIWANNPFIAKHPGLADLLESRGITPEQLNAIAKIFSQE